MIYLVCHIYAELFFPFGGYFMSDCENLEKCAFFEEFKIRSCDPDFADLVIKGLVRMYCKGNKQDTCIRKMISKKLGSNQVPINLMPCGRALTNTTDDSWAYNVVSIINQAKQTS
jgi:hypothetical protein